MEKKEITAEERKKHRTQDNTFEVSLYTCKNGENKTKQKENSNKQHMCKE